MDCSTPKVSCMLCRASAYGSGMIRLASQKRHPGRHLLRVSLRSIPMPLALPSPINRQLLKVRNLRHHPGPQNGHGLLRITRIALPPCRSVAPTIPPQTRPAPSRCPGTASAPPSAIPVAPRPGSASAPSRKSEIIQEMTRFTQYATAALAVIRIPMLRIQFPRRHPVTDRFRTRHARPTRAAAPRWPAQTGG